MKTERTKPDHSCLMLTPDLMRCAKEVMELGGTVKHDKDAGTLEAKDGQTTVIKAIQKGHEQPWIVSFYNSTFIRWSENLNDPQ